MKKIHLIRHSKASFEASTDFDRPLTEEGKVIAQYMGAVLKREIRTPDLVLASPARRTFTTAFLLCGALGIESNQIETDEQIFHASLDRLLQIVNELDDQHQEVMLIGHNPAISQLANLLLNEYSIMFSPCTLCSIDLPIDSWQEVTDGIGTQNFYESPEKHGL